jgi:DNA-binding MarR family transcriptional regulator
LLAGKFLKSQGGSVPSAAPILDEDTAVRLRVAIARLSRRLRPTAAGSAAGLTPTRISVLLTVVREERIRIAALAATEGLNPTMLSRAISRLNEDGLIARVSDDGDRRSAWVQSTPAGRRLTERMRRERTDALNQALARLSAADRQVIELALPALEGLSEQLQDRPS